MNEAIIIESVAKRHHYADGVGVKVSNSKMEIGGSDKELIVTSVINTATVDLDNEVVLPSGADMKYFLGGNANPEDGTRAVYWNHDYMTLPVAACKTIKKSPNSIIATAVMSRHPFAKDVAIAIEDGAVRGTSVGFKYNDRGPPSAEERAKYGANVTNIVRSWLMLEYSFTANPANGEALITLVERGKIDRKSAYYMGAPDVTPERKSWPTTGPAGESAPVAVKGRRVVVVWAPPTRKSRRR